MKGMPACISDYRLKFGKKISKKALLDAIDEGRECIVADTSLIARFFLETALTPLAQRVRKKEPIWGFPPLWREEYANVLANFSRAIKQLIFVL